MDASLGKLDFRPDLRRRRAQHITALIMQEIEHLISDEQCRDVHGALFKVLFENGAAWTTDDERAKFGFEPRDDSGWTPSEHIAEKQQRLEAMLALSKIVHFLPTPPAIQPDK